jgi:hypothetical protein
MGGSARLFLIGYVSGLPGVTGLDAFVSIILHLLLIRSDLLLSTRLLLSRCRYGDRGSKSDKDSEN